MALDGIMFEGAQVRIRRPADYNAAAAAPLGPSMPNPNLNLAAIGLDKQPVPLATNLMSQMVGPPTAGQPQVSPPGLDVESCCATGPGLLGWVRRDVCPIASRAQPRAVGNPRGRRHCLPFTMRSTRPPCRCPGALLAACR